VRVPAVVVVATSIGTEALYKPLKMEVKHVMPTRGRKSEHVIHRVAAGKFASIWYGLTGATGVYVQQAVETVFNFVRGRLLYNPIPVVKRLKACGMSSVIVIETLAMRGYWTANLVNGKIMGTVPVPAMELRSVPVESKLILTTAVMYAQDH
jgi:hypothetical protein